MHSFQDKQIRHLPDAIKLLSLAWYHTTTALYKHYNALQVEDMRGQTQTVKNCIQQKS